MRIPPAVAQQIGQHYAAARVNDAAARDLGTAATSVNSALVALGSSNQSSAVADVRRAADLVASVAGITEPGLSSRVRDVADQAAVVTRHAVELLEAGSAPVDLLSGLASTLAGGAEDATVAAAYDRFLADELASQWL